MLKPRPTQIFREVCTYKDGTCSVRMTYRRELYDAWKAPQAVARLASIGASAVFTEGSILWKDSDEL